MLHRLKLRLLYKSNADPTARRKKLRVILIAGFIVYLPFLALAYFISFEQRPVYLVVIGFLSALTSMPVAFYGYAEGFGQSCRTLCRERPTEMTWLCFKIGFLYGFFLYWMILGIVEFLFGYSVVRAALISFIAGAVARDGFEIGVFRSHQENRVISVFPDEKSIAPFLSALSRTDLFWVLFSFCAAGGIGFLLGHSLINPLYQTFAAALIGGIITTLAARPFFSVQGAMLPSKIRFFIWPGLIMSASYFLTLAYLVRILFHIDLSPETDLALLISFSSTWLTTEILFLGSLTQK